MVEYLQSVQSFVQRHFVSCGFEITSALELDTIPESAKYDGLVFAINHKKIVYRNAHITPVRPGGFLALWQRPVLNESTKPIPLTPHDLDYLMVYVNDVNQAQRGLFIFPVSELIKRDIVKSDHKKGKTGFRVFPSWSADRGSDNTSVFSPSGKKTQAWQLPFFVKINHNETIDSLSLHQLIKV